MADESRLFRAILNTDDLNLGQWGVCPRVAASVIIVAEAWKTVLRSQAPPGAAAVGGLESETGG